jgi:hypothetical protein
MHPITIGVIALLISVGVVAGCMDPKSPGIQASDAPVNRVTADPRTYYYTGPMTAMIMYCIDGYKVLASGQTTFQFRNEADKPMRCE